MGVVREILVQSGVADPLPEKQSCLLRYLELCTVTRNYQNAFSALDVTKVERAKAGKTNCCR